MWLQLLLINQRLRSATIRPSDTPLRAAVDVSLALPGGSVSRLGMYRDTADGWDLVGDHVDKSKRTIGGGTRRFGRFALFRDVRAPVAKLRMPPRATPPGPYPLWALEASIAERGSGLDSRATYFIVDGRRVPSEWDSVIQVLRWRPLKTPANGRHTVTVVATDRAGNLQKTSGTFVVG